MSAAKPEKEIERRTQIAAWHKAVGDAARPMLPRLRSLPPPELLALMQEADVHLGAMPVYKTGDKTYSVPLWGKRGMTGAQLTALVLFGVWIRLGEDEQLAGGVMADWREVIEAVVR